MITRTMILLIAFTNAMILATTTMLTGFIAQHMVFDIDKVRAQHMRELAYTYNRACKKGTEYPEEYRMSSDSFNSNSPVSWCFDRSQEDADIFTDSAFKLGR